MATYKVKQMEPTGVLFADPAKPDSTIRFKGTDANKGLNGVTVKNFVEEIIVNENHAITINGSPAADPLSIRIRISGTQASSDRLKEFLLAICAQLPDWIDEGVLQGFRPETAPVVPAP